MNTRHYLIIAAALFFSCEEKKNATRPEVISQKIKVIRIKGSETVRPVIVRLIELFQKINPAVYIEYEGGGSNLGLMALKQQEADIVFVSRELTTEEIKNIDTANAYHCENFAFDGLSIVVNLANPVTSLNVSQLRGIYAGYIKNWKDLGGKDLPIIVYSRDISSGTYLFLKEKVLDSLDYTRDDVNLVHNKEIVANVIQTPNAIGYVGHGDIDPNLRVVKLAKGSSNKFIEPNYNTIRSEEYPLSRNLYYLYPRNASAEVLQLDSFLRSESTDQILLETGFIPE